MAQREDARNGDRPGTLGGLRELPEFRGPVEPHDEDAYAYDHLALVYESAGDQFDDAVPFVAHGLERGERCLYVADEHSRADVLDAMRKRGVDVDAALESDALAVETTAEASLARGNLDPDDALAFFEDALRDANEDGRALRVTGEMTWVLDDDPSVDGLLEYERALDRVLPESDCIALCQYNRERFPARVVRDVLRTHPHLVHQGRVCRNVYYTPPAEVAGPDHPESRVDRMLSTLRERTDAKVDRRNHTDALRSLQEIAADADRTFDEKLAALFDLGRDYFGMDLGGLAKIDPETDTFQVETVRGDHDHLVSGATVDLSETYCRVHVDGGGEPAGVTDPEAAGFAGTTAYTEFGVRSYLGARVHVSDDADRTVFFASTTPREREFSDAERTFHHLLAEWVGNELERKRRTDRLTTLDDLNDVLHEIANDVIRQSTREEIEAAACERLAAAASYEFAWIAEVDQETRNVIPRAEAGVDGYLDTIGLSADPDDQIGRGPAGKTFRRGELQVVRNVFEDPAFAPWRDLAAEYGYRSVATVPVTHGDTLYGVAGVYSTREDAFGADERALVEQIGEVVGHAIAAVERKQALLSDAVVELAVRVEDPGLPTGGASPARVAFDDIVPVGDGVHQVYGSVPAGEFDAMAQFADAVAEWRNLDRVGSTDDSVRFQMRVDDLRLPLTTITDVGGEFRRAVLQDDHLSATLHLPSGADTRSVLATIRESFPDANVVSKRELRRVDAPTERVRGTLEDVLTDRQREVVRAAYYSGYFEWPRETSGEELADALGVASPTVSQHLRAAEKKVFRELLAPADEDANGREDE